MTTLWGGRFSQRPDPLAARFTHSIGFDQRLWDADITGSIAWARAICRAGLLTEAERDRLIEGLEAVRAEWASGTFVIHPDDEDIHTANERRLGEIIGKDLAGKLHTGRSRNDQVVTDVRLWLRDVSRRLRDALIDLQKAAIERAEAGMDVLMPGYTHLQRAQPVRFALWMMAYFWMWQRDRERLDDLMRRADLCPLGAGALAGNPFSVDRHALAEDLGFPDITQNAMDTVSDRDFILEFLSWAAILGVHLSRLAADLTLWCTAEFGFVTLSDKHSTGSSLMPQKKNPDTLELLRGKAGRLIGDLTALLTVVKGLPLTYNSDLQEDKERLFDAADTLMAALPLAAAVLREMTIHPDRMAAALSDDLLATDLADYLVRKGMPFRESHHVVGRVVRRAEELGIPLSQLPLSELQAISPLFDQDVKDVWDFERSVERRRSAGGTARAAIEVQIAQARKLVEE
ncbi:MAG TPA: argininosuccinate lyase [Caldilineae bacterium]|nr:argininosuccinate lyase [Caldilineae bacterium]